MRKFITGKGLMASLIALVVLASIAGYAWNRHVHQAPEVVFWKGLEASLTTSAVTCDIDDSTAAGSSQQTVRLDLASKTNVQALTTLKQAGSTVTTETIDTKTAEFIRYKALTTKQKDVAGKPLNFSSILNVWSKQTLPSDPASRLYDKTAYGGCIVPLANLNHDQVSKLMAELRKNKVFKTDFSKSTMTGTFLQPRRTYQVTIEPTSYLTFMKQFSIAQGSKVHDTLNVANYAGKSAEKLTFVMHPNSYHVVSIENNNSNRAIGFSNYGVKPDTTVPDKTVTAAALQTKLQAIK